MRRKRLTLFNSEQAKEFMAKAGDDFETEGHRLIKDDYAALKNVKTALELCAYIDRLSAALFASEITTKEADAGIKAARQLLQTARNRG